MRYFRDKQMVRAHLAARAKESPSFKCALFATSILTKWSALEFMGSVMRISQRPSKESLMVRVGVMSIPEYVALPLR
jgi:hypothetical protein